MIIQIKDRPGYYFTGHGYYGGEYDIQGTISEDNFDKILDLIDMYIDHASPQGRAWDKESKDSLKPTT